ncbi:hypothetical protein ACLMJK_002197 [Lecanora helva]
MESGTSLQAVPDNALPQLAHNLPSPPHHHRRQVRYATPENSTQPQFILETAANNQRSISSNHRSARIIGTPSPATLAQPDSTHQAYEAMSSPSLPPPSVDGQDHDRMETDEENEGSNGSHSEDEVDTPAPESNDAGSAPDPPPPVQEDAMDTSPDQPTINEPPPPEPSSPMTPGGTSMAEPQLHLVHVQIPNGNLEASETAQNPAIASSEHTDIDEARGQGSERESQEPPATPGGPREPDSEQAQENRQEAGGEEDEGEEDSEDSSDEEEQPYWVNLKEDTSAPDERELKILEESGNEVSALDTEHWESMFYKPLDDPEYAPDSVGCITWTVKGVHGTPDKPNRERIMRSPSVCIGGYYWNIKYFPHGNDGTEQLSIYIECSPTPIGDAENENTPPSTTAAGPEDTPIAESSDQNPSNNNLIDENAVSLDGVNTQMPSVQESTMEDDTKLLEQHEAETTDSWGVAAQIGCVLYNPEEPRVNVYQKGCHRYYGESPDWGWTRFHGPWDEIHKRQRYQRQALLRNDTLSFTAYIRTIMDNTLSLWWHPPKDKPAWDSEKMTGCPPVKCPTYHSSASIAALSAWLHLQPIRNLIRSIDATADGAKRMKATFQELQYIYEKIEGMNVSADRSVNLKNLVGILNFYGANIDSKTDVVRIWETLRRILNYEAVGLDCVEDSNTTIADLFKDVTLLKQPDPLNNASPDIKYPKVPTNEQSLSSNTEPHSVQEVLDKASSEESNAFRLWQSFEGQRQEPPFQPAVLQIELHRQGYNEEARKWQKLTHHIKLDDTVVFNEMQYTLYGIIVHSGELESNEYYSVLRPKGPGTRWISYKGDNHERKVEILSYKQAIKDHEGSDETSKGPAAVAYITLYVRTEQLPGILCTPFKRKYRRKSQASRETTNTSAEAGHMTDTSKDEVTVPVYIYGAEVFEARGGYSGRGVCDPWVFLRENRFVKQFQFPSSITISQLKERVNSRLTEAAKPKTSEMRLWPIGTYAVTDAGMPVTNEGAYPSLLSYKKHCNKSLRELGIYSGEYHFWMKIVDKVVTTDQETSAPVNVNEADRGNEDDAREAAIRAVMSSISAAEEHLQEQNRAPGETADTEMTGTETTNQENDRQRRRRQQQLLYQMQQAQQQQQQLAAQHAEQARLQAARNAQKLKETYFLVKVFDADDQTLRGVGSTVAKSESKIVEETKKLLKIDSSEAWDLYHERGHELSSRDCVKAHETFESKCGGADGTIIIAQRRPSAASIATYEAEGKCPSPIGYFRYLQGIHDPSLLRDKVLRSYFGADYEFLSLKSGVAHGQGTQITLAGDAYNGNFVAGVKAGQGTMAYANGDTYTGKWQDGEPNGQGKMVYAKTGNTYVGGFKKRKRYGKGTMTYEVADETQNFCRICYEAEMNALFYECGHVVACEECARQVDECPVCRRNVRAVVRIWQTT